MSKKHLILLAIIVVLIGWFLLKDSSKPESESMKEVTSDTSELTEEMATNSEASIKEFDMESYGNMVDGTYTPRFSRETITVKKGDVVKINVNTTSGTHDFTLDEFNVFAETPEGEITVVEFTADTAGEFVYYCGKGKHKEWGQWGTLIVTE